MTRNLLPLLFLCWGYLSVAVGQPSGAPFEAIMQHHYGSGRSPGGFLLVVNEGRVLFAKGYGVADLRRGALIDSNTHFRMASVSKQFTAMSIYLLNKSGKLSLDAPLKHFFSPLAGAVGGITVRQLLTHTSGIWDYEPLIPESQQTQVLDADVLELIRSQPQTYFPPGSQFRYSNTGYCLLSLIVEQVSGMPYSEFVRQSIFVPLGMQDARVYESNADIAHRAYGYRYGHGDHVFADQSLTSAAKGDGGIYLSAAEYLTWSKALMRGDFPLVGYLKMLAREQVPVKDGVRYGFGWFIGTEDDGTTCLFHSGETTGFRNMVYLNPEKSLAVVLFTNSDDQGIADVFDQIARQLRIGLRLGDTASVSLFRWLSRVY